MTYTEEELFDLYKEFGALMLYYYLADTRDGELFEPIPFTMTADNGKIYTMTVDIREETLQ